MAALKFLFSPGSLQLLTVAVLAGAVLARICGGRYVRVARWWITVWAAAYVALSLPLVALMLNAGLSVPQPAPETMAGTDTIVVLSGTGRRFRIGDRSFDALETGTMVRAMYAARLYEELRAQTVIVSGAGVGGEHGPEVVAMRGALNAFGVPHDRIQVEAGSRDTHDSASAVRTLLAAQGRTRVALVTSAQHMTRALCVFRRAGIDPAPAPAPLMPHRFRRGWRSLFPDIDAMSYSQAAVHEYVGLVYYWMRGWL